MTPLIRYPNYSVTEEGHIWSHHTNKFLTEVTQNSGYLRVYIDGLYRNLARLVAETYLPNPDSLPQVNHKNEIKTNNSVSNLEWCTRSYNQSYSKSKNWDLKSPSGEHIHFSNLREFVRKENLNRQCLYRLLKGTQHQHRGWTLWSNL